MSGQAFTLAAYRVRPGREDDFVAARSGLAEAFTSLPNPPLLGTLIRHPTGRTLFYSFGPWRSREDVGAMRESPAAAEAFRRLQEPCDEPTPVDYEVVRHVNVAQS